MNGEGIFKVSQCFKIGAMGIHFPVISHVLPNKHMTLTHSSQQTWLTKQRPAGYHKQNSDTHWRQKNNIISYGQYGTLPWIVNREQTDNWSQWLGDFKHVPMISALD